MNALLLLAAPDAQLLPSASTFAPAVDQVFLLAAWFAVFLVVLASGAMLLVLFGARPGAAASVATLGGGARRVVQSGVLISVLLVAGFLVHGAWTWADLQVIPRGALPIQVALGDKGWSFTYPNGYVATELHLPIDRPVKLRFQAAREPYTFSVPAFRLQVPVAQGAKRDAWVEPTLAGEFDVRSTLRPASVLGFATAQAVVHAEGGYDKWYQDISGPPLNLPPIELGQRSYQMRGCTQCHTVDGNKLVGPSFKGFLAREHKLTTGAVVEPNDAYIQESIEDPTAKVVAGFEPVMPSFKGRLSEPEIKGLIAYIKSLQ